MTQHTHTHDTFGFVKKVETQRSKKSGRRNTFIFYSVIDKVEKMFNLLHSGGTRCTRTATSRCCERKIKADQSHMKRLLWFGEVLDQEVRGSRLRAQVVYRLCLLNVISCHDRFPPVFPGGGVPGVWSPATPPALLCLRAGRRAGPRGPDLRRRCFLSDH